MDFILHNEKVKLILKLITITLGIYLAFRFLLPLIWPVIVGYLISKIIFPVVNFLHKKVQFNRNLATVLSLGVFVVISLVAGFFLGKMLITQATRLGKNWNVIVFEIDCQVKSICYGFEKGLNLKDGQIYMLVSEGFSNCLKTGKNKVVSMLMNNSVSAFIKMIEGVVVVFVAIMSAFFFIKDSESISNWFSTYPFAKETKFISGKLKFVFKAYLKAQLIIMLGTCVVCFIGFTIMKNPYSLIVAIIAGFLDALPMIGIGVILIPWAIICIIAGSAKNGIVLIVIFVICYILREVIEPRIIGGKVGIPPLTSIITIYAGYRLFGIIGVVLGPVAYVMIKESLRVQAEE